MADSAIDRFSTPLYAVAEAARYLGVSRSTATQWARGYRRQTASGAGVDGASVLTALSRNGGRGPEIPFIGQAEGVVLTALPEAGVPLQRIRPALKNLDVSLGLAHALASQRLFTDGVEVLFDEAIRDTDADDAAEALRELVVARNGQRVFNEMLKGHLQGIEFGEDGYPVRFRLPVYSVAEVVVDPQRSFGQPMFARVGARLEDALSLFRAGEPLNEVAEEYGIPSEQLEDAIRIATRVAA